MNKVLAAFGASALALSLMLDSAEAKTIRYEINGKYYTYDSTSPQEIAVARKLIEAANAADQAQAVADAERASNPLAALFGSQAQKSALAARAHLERVLAEEAQAALAASAQQPSPQRETARAPAKAAAATPAVTRQKPRQEVTAKPASPAEPPQAAAGADDADPVLRNEASPTVQSVFVDPESGIKTVFMADGSVREEALDVNALAKEGEQGAAETTGSTTPRGTPVKP